MLASSETILTSILYVQMAATKHSTILHGAFRPRCVSYGDSLAIYVVTESYAATNQRKIVAKA